MSQIDYKKYIEIDTDVRFGKPVIKETRITVYDVPQWLASGMTREQIIEDFPQLNENRYSPVCHARQTKKE